ncbi:ATP-binding protein [Photobacterium angustum]|uniref:ATP-binding protein n=1 Tax=Photobacterium angustum TaxID=661 RepID=UPI0005E3A9AB|nr:ATP-binding protein [Photobacterium angustum]KJF92475.1 hypothetical protein UB39_20560 [Photobacterium angustum]
MNMIKQKLVGGMSYATFTFLLALYFTAIVNLPVYKALIVACTEKGSIVISVTPSRISIIDTGIGLEKKPRGVEGYGLGLLISRDICHKYGYEFEILNNPHGGCRAQISIQPTQ